MKYGLYDKPPLIATVLTALQWVIVTVSSSVAVPLMIGDIYGLQLDEIGNLMQQTLFFIGLASLLQVWIGHRYPMMEGPAGLWWGIFVILAQIGTSIGLHPKEIGQSFQLGLIMAGLLFLVLGLAGWIDKLQKWFTPLVTGTYMILLAVSLCSNMLGGMLGIGYAHATEVNPVIAVVSVAIVAVVIWLMRIQRLSSFAVLFGMVGGWLFYAIMGWTEPVRPADAFISMPSLFFWGTPRWDWGVVLTSMLTGFVLLTNLVTSIVVMGKATNTEPSAKQYNRGGVFTGVSHILSGLSGVVGMIPLSLAAAVIQTSKMAARLPFFVAMGVIMLIGVFPAVSHFLAAIPTPVAYAALFITYTKLLGFGLKDFASLPMDERTLTVGGSSLLVGIGIMFVPATAWQSMPPLFSFLFGNGLLLGVIVCLVLEHIVFRQREDTQTQKDGHL